MNWDALIPLLTLLTSLVPSALIFMMREGWVWTRTAVNLAGATIKLALISVMLWGVFHEHQYEFRFPILAGVDFVLRADALAMFFVTLSAVLWFLTTIYAIAYLEGSPHRSRFFGFFSLCVSATIGIGLAGNLFTFVLFYELLTLSTYPLVVHRETDVACRAGRTYLYYTLSGGALLLAGAAWLHALVPTVDFSGGAAIEGLAPVHDAALRIIFFLLIGGLGVKAALVPLHGWLPHAMVAPAPVSALLHAVAVVKAGAFGIVRVVYDVYGVDRADELGLAMPLAVWAAVTILYGSARALFQDDLKARLAYSTISQVSYIALGVAIIGPSSSVGGIVHLVHQGLMKITLFFCAGNLAEFLGIKKISEMHGVGRRMPWTMGAFTAAALGMIGIPPTVGFISKWYLGSGSIEASQHWVLLVLVASSVMNAAYFLPILAMTWFDASNDSLRVEEPRSGLKATWGMLLPPIVTAVLSVGTGLLAGTPFSPLQWTLLIVERAYGRAVIDRGLVNTPVLLTPENALLLLTLAAPVAAACLLMFPGPRRVAAWLAAFSALPAVALAFVAKPEITLDLDWLLLHMHLGLDRTGQPLMLLTAVIWLLAGIYSRGYLVGDRHTTRFYFYFLLAMTGNLGVILALDMASFYLFFAVMSFASYPLVVHRGDDEARRAGRVYISLVVVGEAALLSGMLLLSATRGSLLFDRVVPETSADVMHHLILGLFLFGFAIKTGILPLHVWLPLAYSAAPTPASAVLSGAMIKAGLLGWLRFLPIGETTMPNWGNLCMIFGLTTAFYGVLVGVTQRNPKSVLAYSSISQMGLLTLGIGGGLLVPAAWPAIESAILVFALHHGLSKACLFLSVGIAPGAAGTHWRQRLLQAGLVLPALALAGAPLTMGAVSKSGLQYSLKSLPESWITMLDVLLPLSSIATTVLMARFLYLVWPVTAPRYASQSIEATDAQPRPNRIEPTMLLSWSAMLAVIVATPWLIPNGLVAEGGSNLLAKTAKWPYLWPVCLGGLIAWTAYRTTRSVRRSLPSLPPGDILVPLEIAHRTMRAWIVSLAGRSQRKPFEVAPFFFSVTHVNSLRHAIQSAEALMAHKSAVAVSMLLVGGMLLLLWGSLDVNVGWPSSH
jgi:multicomponent Na+:H+ antiporter subunit D